MILDTGHRLPITSVCVSASSNPYICSCSDDKVILWSLDDFSCNYDRTSNTGLLVGVDLGCISDCSISCDNSWLALCRESDMWIVGLQVSNTLPQFFACLQSNRHLNFFECILKHTDGVLNAVSHHATLESSGEAPSFCCFSPRVENLLVTADDSNGVKVLWLILQMVYFYHYFNLFLM